MSTLNLNNDSRFGIDRLQLPSSLSSWVLAASLFMNPMSGVRLMQAMSYGDFLFALAGVIAFCERGLNRERIFLFPIYLASAILITLSFVANHFMPEHMGVMDYISFINTFINNHAEVNFGQGANFRILFASLIVFPQVFLALRIKSFGEVRLLTYFWLAGAAYGATFTFLFCNGWISGHEDYYWLTFHRAKGLTGTPNALAINTAIAFPILAMLFMEKKNLILRMIVLVAAFMMWRAIGYSGSRTGVYVVMATSAMMFVVIYIRLPERARPILIGLGVLATGIFVVKKYLIGFDISSSSAFSRIETGSNVSDTVRAHDWDVAVAGFMNSPIFGAGYQWFYTAHNVYLEVLHSAGLVGFVGYMLGLTFPLYRAWQSDFLRQEVSGRLCRDVLLVTTAGVLISGWAQPNTTALNLNIPCGLLLFLSVAHFVGRAGDVRNPALPVSGSAVAR